MIMTRDEDLLLLNLTCASIISKRISINLTTWPITRTHPVHECFLILKKQQAQYINHLPLFFSPPCPALHACRSIRKHKSKSVCSHRSPQIAFGLQSSLCVHANRVSIWNQSETIARSETLIYELWSIRISNNRFSPNAINFYSDF